MKDTGAPAPTRDLVDSPIRPVREADGRFERVAVRRYDWDQSDGGDGYRKAMPSCAGTQTVDGVERLGPLDETASLIRREFAGRASST